MKVIHKLGMLALLLTASAMALASGAEVHLDKAPIDLKNTASLQRGAKLFTSRCLACHGASYMRYNRLRDIGMSEDQIKQITATLEEKGKVDFPLELQLTDAGGEVVAIVQGIWQGRKK